MIRSTRRAIPPWMQRALVAGLLITPGVPVERSFRLPSASTAADPFHFHLLVVLVEFEDIRGSSGDNPIAPEDVYDRIFGNPTRSLAAYWREASGGRFIVEGTVTEWVRLDSTYAWYTSEGAGNAGSGIDPDAYPHNAQRITEEVVTKLAGRADWRDYDNNGDGLVDGLLVLHAGPGLSEAGSGTVPDPRLILQAHQFHTSYEVPVQATRVFDYAFAGAGGAHGVATHEFGHLLGLIDLYDTGIFSGSSGPFGVGNWSLMGTGALLGNAEHPAGLDADSRLRLGFEEPIVVNPGGAPVDIHLAANDQSIWKLPAGGDSLEYFLVEGRWKQGIDSELPGEGLLVWHIDEHRPANRGPDPYRVSLVQPDNRNDLGRIGGNRGDAGDAWPYQEHNALTDETTPSSAKQDGTASGVAVESIVRDGSNVTAHLSSGIGIDLVITHIAPFELDGFSDADGEIEPGEYAQVLFEYCNRGRTNPGVFVVSGTGIGESAPWVEINTLTVEPGVPPGLCVWSQNGFEFGLKPDAPPLGSIALRIIFNLDPHPALHFDLLVPCRFGAPVVLSASPGEAAFTAASLVPDRAAPWSVDESRFHSAPSAWRLGPSTGTRYDPRIDAVYVSPMFVVPSDSPRFSIWSAIDAETLSTGRAWDGGEIEISDEVGNWHALVPAGGWPVELETGSANTLAGREAFSGHDGSFHREVFDLAPWAGMAAQIRFRFASDAFTDPAQSQTGWWLDDLTVETAPPPPPLNAVAAGDSVTVTWTGSPGSHGYETPPVRLYRRIDAARSSRILVGQFPAFSANLVEHMDHPGPGRWIYSIRPIDADGDGLESEASPVTVDVAGSTDRLSLFSNPYRLDGPPLTVEYFLPGESGEPVEAQLRLYDVAGRLRETLLEGLHPAGEGRLRWPADPGASQPPPGIYFLRLTGRGFEPQIERVVITR